LRLSGVASTRYVISEREHDNPESNNSQFPGRQKIIVSKCWGFTPLRREEYLEKRKEGKIKIDGAYVQFLRNKGNLASNMRRFPEAFAQEA
jgi:large subunit ribosomal protein L10e